MLALDDSRWRDLQTAYGSATDIPGYLEAVQDSPAPSVDPQNGPWGELWSALCHQDDVHTASYAAVPHLVRIALASPGPIDFSFFALPAAIHVALLDGRGPAVPEDLMDSYGQAITDLRTVVLMHAGEEWDGPTAQSALAALAVAQGHSRLGAAIITLDDELIDRLIALDL